MSLTKVPSVALVVIATWLLMVKTIMMTAPGVVAESLREEGSLSRIEVVDVQRTHLNERLLLTVRNEETLSVRTVEMKLDTGLYAQGARVEFGNGESRPLSTRNTYISTRTTVSDWASATVESETKEGRIRISGVVSLDGEIHVINSSKSGHRARRLEETSTSSLGGFTDAGVPIPDREVIPPLQNMRLAKSSDNAFFPGCFPNDENALAVQISIATDWGFVQRVNADNPDSSLESWTAKVISEVERSFRGVRPIYLGQLNVLIEIQRVIIGNKTFPNAPALRRERDVDCLSDPLLTLREFATWVKSSATATGHWHLLTDCHPMPGMVGAGYDQGLCESFGFNTAVSSWQFDDSMWRIVAHEMGHVFGAAHTFYSGRGGLMDYGSGRLNGGEVLFHPDNRPQICAELSQVLSRECRFVKLVASNASCGNGMLEPNEECECRDSSVSCGVCDNCKLTQPRECNLASDPYVVRQPLVEDIVTVTSTTLDAHADCCTPERKLVGQSCNNGKDVCSARGHCSKACSAFFLPACGFDDTGCIQMCVFEGRCQGAELVTMGPPVRPAGMVPNGVKCKTSAGAPGTCNVGVCIAGSASEVTASPVDPGASLTRSPTRQPTTASPTTSTPAPSTGRPTSASPTLKPTTGRPTTGSPTLKPTTGKPTTGSPTIKIKPTTSSPTTRSPTIKLTTSRPTTRSPTIKPTTLRPTTGSPTIKLTTGRPTTLRPTTSSPTSSSPTTTSPTTATPKEEVPTSRPVAAGKVTRAPTRRPSRLPTGRPTRPTRRVLTTSPTFEPTPIPSTTFPSLSPTFGTKAPTASPSSSPSQAPSSSPSIACPSMALFYKCSSAKNAQACTRQGCAWCNSKLKCQATRLVCRVGGARFTSKVYPHCPPFSLRRKPSPAPSNMTITECPLPEAMSACAFTNTAKTCPKNPFVQCRWCAGQKSCVPLHGQTSCSFAACPRLTAGGR